MLHRDYRSMECAACEHVNGRNHCRLLNLEQRVHHPSAHARTIHRESLHLIDGSVTNDRRTYALAIMVHKKRRIMVFVCPFSENNRVQHGSHALQDVGRHQIGHTFLHVLLHVQTAHIGDSTLLMRGVLFLSDGLQCTPLRTQYLVQVDTP